MTLFRLISCMTLPCLAAVLGAGPALAQLQLPGAPRASTPVGATTSPTGAAAPRSGNPEDSTPKPVMVRAPSERTLEGRTLALNGRTGVLRFARSGDKLELVEIKLSGDKLSRVGESCTMTLNGPFSVAPEGRANGLLQFKANVDACPFTFSVLDGAVMVSHNGAQASTGLGAGTCDIQAQDCRGYLAGFWGPPGAGIGPGEAKAIEATRSDAEKNARANYRNLIRNARNDKDKTRQIASDQAGFSARREEVCRDYVREHQHGFCASRYTQARAVALAAQLGAVQVDDGTAKPEAKPKPRPRPKPPAQTPGQPQPGMASPAPLQPTFR